MKSYLIINILLFASFCFGQNEQNIENEKTIEPIVIKYKRTTEGIALRFIPANSSIWKESIENGFIVQRKLIGKNNIKGNFSLLTKTPLTPASLEEISDPKIKKIQGELLWTPLEKYNSLVKTGNGLKAGLGLKELYKYYIFASTRNPKLADKSGMIYNDNTASPDSNYIFQISIPNTDYKSQIFFSSDYQMLKAPKLSNKPGDSTVVLEWVNYQKHSPFVAYYLEKSEDGINFNSVYKDPIYDTKKEEYDSLSLKNQNKMTWTDSLAENGKPYYYRLIGLDFFGEKSIPSDTIEVIGVDKTPPALPNSYQVKVRSETNDIQVDWEKSILEDDFYGFVIFRSEDIKEHYKPLNKKPLSRKIKSFIDTVAEEGVTYYYSIMVIDKSGNYKFTPVMSTIIPDKTPPSAPIGVEWSIDKQGVVKLKWAANPEKDVKGYRVFSSNHPDTDFLSITPKPIHTTFFQDTITLNRLNEKYYYHIVAFDGYYNHSEYSELVTVQIPDTVKPTSPKHLKYTKTGNSTINLSWNNSTSKDVISQIIYIRNKNGWEILDTIDKDKNTYTYKSQSSKNEYPGFRIAAIDDAQNISKFSNEIYIKIAHKKAPKVVTDLVASVLKTGNIKLSWKSPESDSSLRYLIFRAEIDKPFKLYRSTKAQEFIDKNINVNKKYKYQVLVQTQDGHRSKSSKIVSIN